MKNKEREVKRHREYGKKVQHAREKRKGQKRYRLEISQENTNSRFIKAKIQVLQTPNRRNKKICTP